MQLPDLSQKLADAIDQEIERIHKLTFDELRTEQRAFRHDRERWARLELERMRRDARIASANKRLQEVESGRYGVLYAGADISGAGIENVQHGASLARLRRFCEIVITGEKVRKNWAVLTGRPGTGKTHMMIGAMRLILQNGMLCAYYRVGELFDEVKKQCFSDFGRFNTIGEYAKNLADCNAMICLDDVWLRPMTDKDSEILFSVVDSMFSLGKPMIWAMNPTLIEMGEKMGDRNPIMDRILGKSVEISCNWTSLRR